MEHIDKLKLLTFPWDTISACSSLDFWTKTRIACISVVHESRIFSFTSSFNPESAALDFFNISWKILNHINLYVRITIHFTVNNMIHKNKYKKRLYAQSFDLRCTNTNKLLEYFHTVKCYFQSVNALIW